ncbi:hypothetical protein EVAR_25824_1 [Eumeta japonica]|uniref:Uncharacterized protein n=1 Tax=Eumeta variegata TaxID=151549 RepID=A0A4C1VSW2_EUMVA|nr:hypothetical protein EVAR_25824_1 [Eumeta japonica]
MQNWIEIRSGEADSRVSGDVFGFTKVRPKVRFGRVSKKKRVLGPNLPKLRPQPKQHSGVLALRSVVFGGKFRPSDEDILPRPRAESCRDWLVFALEIDEHKSEAKLKRYDSQNSVTTFDSGSGNKLVQTTIPNIMQTQASKSSKWPDHHETSRRIDKESLQTRDENESEIMRNMKTRLHESMNRRFAYVKGHPALIPSTLLDPRFKSTSLNSDEVDIAALEIENHLKMWTVDVSDTISENCHLENHSHLVYLEQRLQKKEKGFETPVINLLDT